MLAESQLELRSRLTAALFALGRLCDEIGMTPSPSSTVNSLVSGMKDPFLFVVAGEVNAGKSMLLNALFGEEFCRTSELPSTDQINYFRHGFERQEVDLGPLLRELQMPCTFLENFHIVDTPGINSVAEGHEAITEQFLPRADAVLFVLPITNPWGAKTWEFLQRIHEDLGKRIVVILQQIDLRTPQEIEAVSAHVKLCLRKWLGRDLPVFCVSARKALLARTSGIGKEDLLKQSAIQPLEAHISAILQESAGRIDRTGNTVRMGQILLAQAQKYLLDKSQTLAALGSVLQKIAGLVQEQKTRSWEACLLSLKPLDKVLQRVGQEIPAALNPAQSGWRTALQPSSMTAGKAAALTWHQDARAALNHHAVAVEKIMRQDLVKLWKQTQGPLTKALGHAPKPATEGELEPESLRADHHQLLADLRSEESWGQASRLQLEIRRRRFLFASMLGGLGLVLAAVGAFQAWWALVALGVLLLGLGPWIALRAQQNYVKNFPLKLQECSANDAKRVRQMADVALQKWLQRAFQGFSVNFKPLLDRSEQMRRQQDLHTQGIAELRQTFQELAEALKS